MYIARISEPAADPANVKVKVTLYLPRTAAERLMVRAIEQDKNFETLLRDILERAAGEQSGSLDHLIKRTASHGSGKPAR